MQAQEIRKAPEPRKFIEAVGWRAALLGHEDGTFEAWMMPVKVLRDFKLSVYFDGSLEPVPLADLAERVTVAPGHVTITHANAAFTIRQTWVPRSAARCRFCWIPTPPVRCACASFRGVRCGRSFGGQAAFDPAEKRWSSRRACCYAAVVGSPFTRSSEQIGHQLPEHTVLLEMDITPEGLARAHSSIAGSGGLSGSVKLYKETLAGAVISGEINRTTARSRKQPSTWRRRTHLNQAIGPSCGTKVGCDDGVGCGWWRASDPPEQASVGFAWFFGGDALVSWVSRTTVISPARAHP
jgi:hypothetical protein